jgi:hypothetical protein
MVLQVPVQVPVAFDPGSFKIRRSPCPFQRSKSSEMPEWPKAGLLIFFRKYISQFDFQPSQDCLELVERDVVLTALDSVKRRV